MSIRWKCSSGMPESSKKEKNKCDSDGCSLQAKVSRDFRSSGKDSSNRTTFSGNSRELSAYTNRCIAEVSKEKFSETFVWSKLDT